ncbi:hypothetical protein [Ligilactobacillus ceti]|uniref:Bacterial archaeo-eukaryotic release factor family 6 domain-containing protein n=1 Tax=Ligilactobacillus ceti DSM 22408 TaxID=1122146 RepID=A0A0R2KRQ3_9LACO|nr:hypothetical protein [Ligilactobacillus ceti]KRN88788.1 hypothetical protein IV53_GL000756 [Ligilactobacillus ceti DSM 22408]
MKKQDVINIIKDFSSDNTMPVATIYFTTEPNISYNHSELKSLVKALKTDHEAIYHNLREHLAEYDLETKFNTSFVIIANAEQFLIATIDVAVENFVHVGPAPIILPLMEMVARPNEFIVLGLNTDNIEFLKYKGGRLEPITDLPNHAPLRMNEGIGEEVNGGQLNDHVAQTGKDIFHDHNMLEQERKIDQTDYYRVVDLYLGENFRDMPIVLKGVAKNISLFHKVCKHSEKELVKDVVIDKNIDDLTLIQQDVLAQFKEKYIFEIAEKLDRARSEKKVAPVDDQFAGLIAEGRVEALIYPKQHDQWKLADIVAKDQSYAEVLVKGIDVYPVPAKNCANVVAILRY